jgi:hypothetical protein
MNVISKSENGTSTFLIEAAVERFGYYLVALRDARLELDPRCFIAVVRAILVGDLLDGMSSQIRPYELQRGATDRAIEDAKLICYDALYKDKPLVLALRRAKRRFERVGVDHLRVYPVVREANDFVQRFLDQAELEIQVVSERLARKKLALWAADKTLRAVWMTYATALGYRQHRLQIPAASEAQAAAERELEAALAETGLSPAWVRTYIAKTPALASSLYVPRLRDTYACKAANMVLDVHEHMQTTKMARRTQQARTLVDRAHVLFGNVRGALPGVARDVARAGGEIGEEVWTQIRNRVVTTESMQT